MDYKPYSPEWHRKRYLKEALDKYFDDYVENEVIFGDMMDILSARMSAAVDEVNKVMDLKDKFNKYHKQGIRPKYADKVFDLLEPVFDELDLGTF